MMLASLWNRTIYSTPAALLLLGLAAPRAGADVIIYGSLGNFDCPNNGNDDCNEFDIELEGPHVEDCYHTYHNPNYGSPTVTALAGNTGIRVVYKNPQHATHPGAIEHFGVSLNGAHPVTAQRFQWIPGTVGVPNPPPPPPPPPPLAMPLLTVEIVDSPTGQLIRETVTNVDPLFRTVFVVRKETVANGRHVTLEELMPNDPLIQGANTVDAEPEELLYGAPLVWEEDPPSPGDQDSDVISYDVFDSHTVIVGGEPTNVPGVLIGTLLAATLTVGTNCPEEYLPVVTEQPQNATGHLEGVATFQVSATGPGAYGTVLYQWQHEGIDLDGEDSNTLVIDPISTADLGAYRCVITNDCGSIQSAAAFLTIPPCPGDFDGNGKVNLADLSLLLAHYGQSGGGNMGDMNGNGMIELSDLAAFLARYGKPCP